MVQLTNFQKTFFAFNGEKGISSTEGNTIANIIKELCLDIARRLGKIQPISETIILDSGRRALDEYSAESVDTIKSLALEDGKLYALSAWIREAIKAKETYMVRIKNCPADDLMNEDEVLPDFTESYPEVPVPARPVMLTEEDIIGGFSIAERSEYYELEAMAAHLGNKIHNRGMFVTLRQQIDAYKPTVFRNLGLGTGNSVVECTLLYTREHMEKLYFDLQAQHREYEQKLNGYKARIKDLLNTQNAAIEMDYKLQYAEMIDKKNRLAVAYRMEKEAAEDMRKEMYTKMEARRLSQLNEASALKIRIPHGLQNTFEYVQSFYK